MSEPATVAVGTHLSAFTLPIESTKVAEFARAVRCPVLDEPHLMFSVSSGHIQNRRDLIREIGLDLRRVLHGEHVWRYRRRPVVGETLHGDTWLAAMGEKEGRVGGTMRTATLRTTYTAGGEVVLEEDMLLLETRVVAKPTNATPAARRPSAARADTGETGPAIAPPVHEPALTRTDIVRFAGASGDFNPIHHDEVYARELGLPSVFAMGMLPGGLIGSYVMAAIDPSRVRELRLRFRDRVWPNETLTISGHWADEGRGLIEARCADGRTAVSGTVLVGEAA